MRVLLITHRPPFPPDKGDRIRGWQWLIAVAGRCEVDLLTVSDGPLPSETRLALEDLAANVHVHRAAWPRMVAGLAGGTSLTEARFDAAGLRRRVEGLCRRRGYDACIAVCSSAAAGLLDLPCRPRTVVDLVDIDSVKWARFAAFRRGPLRWLYARESRLIGGLERRVARCADVLVTISEPERELLARLTGRRSVAIPNGFAVADEPPADREAVEPRLVFVGQMDYLPNVDAVEWFGRRVWPSLQGRRPALRWAIVGRQPVRRVRRLARLPNVTVTGQVADVKPYLASGIAIAPIRLACGLQNKILEAVAAGRPTVVSRESARALALEPQRDLLVADRPEEWLAAIGLLLDDPRLARRIGESGRETVRRRYDPARTLEAMLGCVDRDDDFAAFARFESMTCPGST